MLNSWKEKYGGQDKELGRVSLHLPRQLREQAYSVVQCKQLLAPHCTLASVLPVNIIEIALKPNVDISSSHMEFVCTNFDLSCCCVAITLSEKLDLTFHEFCDAFRCLLQRQLVLNPCAFSCERHSVHMQMCRIAKYVHRNFRFPN